MALFVFEDTKNTVVGLWIPIKIQCALKPKKRQEYLQDYLCFQSGTYHPWSFLRRFLVMIITSVLLLATCLPPAPRLHLKLLAAHHSASCRWGCCSQLACVASKIWEGAWAARLCDGQISVLDLHVLVLNKQRQDMCFSAVAVDAEG